MSSPERVGRYSVDETWRIEPLGRVLRARPQDLNRPVYVKELCPPASLSPPDRDRLLKTFDREARILAQMDNPLLPRPHDCGTTEAGTRFLVFDQPECSGCWPLTDTPRAHPAREWIWIGLKVCQALSALSEAGIALRQFQPEWVFVSPAGEVRLLHLGFGHLPAVLGLPGSLAAGSIRYAAPEMLIGGELTSAALVFSTAAWLYTMLSAVTEVSPAALAAAGRQMEPLWSLNPQVRGPVDDVIQKALGREAGHRYPTLRAFEQALALAARESESVWDRARERPGERETESAGDRRRNPSPESEGVAPLLWRYTAWTVGLGVAGGVLGWSLARLIPQH